MHTNTGRHIPRGWRTLFIALALLAMLSGTALPGAARQAWAEQTEQPTGLPSEVAAPLTSQDAALQPGQEQPVPPTPVPGQDGPLPAPAAMSQGKFRY
ncbi:MAG TPA: hypothetical protein VND68_12690, partial [Chloroflexia bacterium]|nr:hypothetical protein [Chloroflexia bacterium]